ncbi:hypothetical protein [Streptomyces sp. Ru72]|uniref:hypothetical protein n=1 Tax=Streptomyces sp. Ru72 TaxID=2080747 RepID=UPI0011B06941|nr:hypothetical protein [Streptomyces sp. Ru72]
MSVTFRVGFEPWLERDRLLPMDFESGQAGTIGRPRAGLRTDIQRPACRRCTHAAGITTPAACWTTHDIADAREPDLSVSSDLVRSRGCDLGEQNGSGTRVAEKSQLIRALTQEYWLSSQLIGSASGVSNWTSGGACAHDHAR